MPKIIKRSDKSASGKSKTVNEKVQSAKKTNKSTGKKLNIKYLGGILLKKMARGGAKELSLNADQVNNLNVFPVPDGDTGDNMRMTIESGVNAIENLDSDNVCDVMKQLSRGMLLGARGNSGVILSQFFSGTAEGLESISRADAYAMGHALQLGVKRAYSSVMSPMEGTILTVARESVEYAVSRIHEHSTIRSLFRDLVQQMKSSLEKTPELLAVLKEANVVDSGGAGLLYIMDGFHRVLNGEEPALGEESVISKPESCIQTTTAPLLDGAMTYGYCTELLLQLQNAKCDPDTFDMDALRSFLGECGDSVVTIKTESILKVHVHTMKPEAVLDYLHRYGEFINVKIENMSVQHSELAAKEQQGKEGEREKYGIVSVCTGEGFRELFTTLGADIVIEGGQTHNPSTRDFLEAFKTLNREIIFVLPNNGNIFMAASQAAQMYTESAVRVIPTKNVGEGYAALSTADLTKEEADVAADMCHAMERVKTGVISPAVRDAELNGISIHSGDTIGIVNKSVVVSEKNRPAAATALARILIGEGECNMLTVFCGTDVDEAEREQVNALIGQDFPNAEVYFTDGGQDVYSYVMVCE